MSQKIPDQQFTNGSRTSFVPFSSSTVGGICPQGSYVQLLVSHIEVVMATKRSSSSLVYLFSSERKTLPRDSSFILVGQEGTQTKSIDKGVWTCHKPILQVVEDRLPEPRGEVGDRESWTSWQAEG